MSNAPRLIAVVGPTAVGKSLLAEEVALALGGAVVSVDAMQVYRGMDIGTAKVPIDHRRCPLFMVDIADISEAYSVQRYQVQCRKMIDELEAKGSVPVLCGGTGLYLNAVIDEMHFPKGETGSSKRAQYEDLAQEMGSEALWSLLKERDPASANLIHPNNVRRVVRALEMNDEGVSYAAHHKGLHERMPHYSCRIWGLRCDRKLLAKRIEQRVDDMLSCGLVEEVQSLIEDGLERSLTSKQAIGYAQIIEYLQGGCSLDEARSKIIIKTRQYAKRQLSWFSHDKRVMWLDVDQMDQDQAAHHILEDFRSHKE